MADTQEAEVISSDENDTSQTADSDLDCGEPVAKKKKTPAKRKKYRQKFLPSYTAANPCIIQFYYRNLKGEKVYDKYKALCTLCRE